MVNGVFWAMMKPKLSVVRLWLSQFFGHGGSSAKSRLRAVGSGKSAAAAMSSRRNAEIR
jgi:hypothetical protein